MYWGSSNTVIPFNPNSLYEIEVRVKKTAGSGGFYCGVTGYKTSFNTNSGQTTLTKVNSSNSLVLGLNTTSQHQA